MLNVGSQSFRQSYIKCICLLLAVYIYTIYTNQQDAQLSQRDRAAGCVIVFAKSRRLELGDNILRTV